MVELKVEWEKTADIHVAGKRKDTFKERLLAGAIILMHIVKITNDVDIASELIKTTYLNLEESGYESYTIDGGAIGANPKD